MILHYPPPIHGAAVIGKMVKESASINNTFNTRHINLSTSRSVDDIGSKSFLKLFRYLTILSASLNKILLWKPDLVYLTISSRGGGLIKDLPLVFLCRLFRKKHVFHFHNKGVQQYAVKYRWADRLYRWLFKKAKVILLSPHLYQDIAPYIDENNLFYCANGIEALHDCKCIPKKKDHPISLLFLSNLIRSKGIFDLLTACTRLKEQNIPFTCTIIGGEGDLSSLELQKEIQKSGLTEDVQYVGKKYGNDKAAHFEQADIFVHPTQEDCFPLVLLEAMSFGLPIISTKEGAIPEIIDDHETGIIIPKENPAQLFSAIKFYHEHSVLIAEHGRNALQKFRQYYTVENFEERLTSIFEELMKQ